VNQLQVLDVIDLHKIPLFVIPSTEEREEKEVVNIKMKVRDATTKTNGVNIVYDVHSDDKMLLEKIDSFGSYLSISANCEIFRYRFW
jgi:hypothetical protein